ncbi:MAG: hypothetical protein J6R45_05555 [Clostridia bacterium]|nr:hypothetical protein [Clostridia bacterium]
MININSIKNLPTLTLLEEMSQKCNDYSFEELLEFKRVLVERGVSPDDPRIQEVFKNARSNTIRQNGLKGYYEYTAVNIYDQDDGTVDVQKLILTLNELAVSGWRLVVGFSNKIGQNASRTGILNSHWENATIDQNILIMERFVEL